VRIVEQQIRSEVSAGEIASRRPSPFILIKNGSGTHPVFIAHGLCGTVQVAELAKHIHTSNPVFGIQGKGIDGLDEPFDRVEDMARFYLEAIESLDAEGPYILVGYSFGGLVALEMAQRLLDKGKRVALLVLIDAYPHPRYLPWWQRQRLSITRARGHFKHMREMPLRKALAYFRRGLERRLHMRRTLEESPGSPLSLPFAAAALQRVKQNAFVAYANYQPRFYRGKINFVTAEKKSFFPEDPGSVWSGLASKLEIDTIPGNHLNIVTTEFKPLAAVLTRHILSNSGSIRN
jgi:acetoacetyl-CoA synthetase